MATNITSKIKVKVLRKGYHRMTSDFGPRSSGFHKGIDLTGNPSDNQGYDYILAFADGIVVGVCNTYSKTGKVGGTGDMGNYVIIDHGNGYKTRYMHMTKGSVGVTKGTKVKAGQVIGYMGNTGNSTGRHLHFDISINGEYVDPKPYLYGEKKFNGTTKAPTTPTPTEKPASSKYTTGTYVVKEAVNVRKTPKVASNNRIYFKDFTKNAKEQVKKLTGKEVSYFPKSMTVSISQINGTWGKCPSGWISLNYCTKR